MLAIVGVCLPDVAICYQFQENYIAMLIGDDATKELVEKVSQEFREASPDCPGSDSLTHQYIVPGACEMHVVPAIRYLWMQIIAHENGTWSVDEARRHHDMFWQRCGSHDDPKWEALKKPDAPPVRIANMDDSGWNDGQRARSIGQLHQFIQLYHQCLDYNPEDVDNIAREFLEASPNCPGPGSLFSEYQHPVGKDESWAQLSVLHMRNISRWLTNPEGFSEFHSTIQDQMRALTTDTQGRPPWVYSPDLIFVHHKNCKGHGKKSVAHDESKK
jgi:hypothetical protein